MIHKKVLNGVLAASVALGLTVSMVTPTFGATIKPGASCTTVNKKSTVGLKTYTCVKQGKKKVWKHTSTAAALGSIQKPVPLGTALKIGDFKFSVEGYSDDASDYVCSENGFNEGCMYDDNFDSVADPDAPKRWVQFRVSAENLTATPQEPYIAEIGVVAGGKLVSQGIFGPSVSDSLGDISILPGMSDTGSVYINLDKTKSPTLLVLIPSSWEKKYYFFNIR